MATLHTITSTVRGGGSGSSAWAARITGVGGAYGLQREWCYKQKNLSRSGRSGTIEFEISQPGIYEYGKVQHHSGRASIGDLDHGFIRVDADGSVSEIDRDEVIAELRDELVDAKRHADFCRDAYGV